jgi:PPIC-type PPIASE domain
VEGTTPRAMLQSNAVARVVREKVEQILFLELGLVQDIRYTTFLDQLEKLNLEREQAARLGRTVYGPVRFTQLQFYQHWKAGLRAEAMEELAEKRWHPRDEDLREFYEENQALFRALPSCTAEVVTVQARKKAATGERADAVRSAADSIVVKLRAGTTLSAVLKERPKGEALDVSGQRFEEINADRLGELFPDEEQVKAVLALRAGETALLVGSDSEVRVVRCLARNAGEVRPYAAVQRQVRERWLDQQYERHIERLAGQAKVKVNQEALDALLP